MTVKITKTTYAKIRLFLGSLPHDQVADLVAALRADLETHNPLPPPTVAKEGVENG